ncbi:hypothetical protein BDF19DRAFT_433033, partial [Syncephalis fuscata]
VHFTSLGGVATTNDMTSDESTTEFIEKPTEAPTNTSCSTGSNTHQPQPKEVSFMSKPRRGNLPRDGLSLSTSGIRSLPPTLRASSSFGSLRSRPSSSTSCSLAIDSERSNFLTYGEFLCGDTRPRWHRRRLSDLQILDQALRDNKKFREPQKNRLRTRHSRDMLKMRSKDIIMRHRTSTIERLNALMPKKKNKKRTKAGKYKYHCLQPVTYLKA